MILLFKLYHALALIYEMIIFLRLMKDAQQVQHVMLLQESVLIPQHTTVPQSVA